MNIYADKAKWWVHLFAFVRHFGVSNYEIPIMSLFMPTGTQLYFRKVQTNMLYFGSVPLIFHLHIGMKVYERNFTLNIL